MRKFCFFFPLVESGIVVGVFGIILWILYFLKAVFERNLTCELSDKAKQKFFIDMCFILYYCRQYFTSYQLRWVYYLRNWV